MSRPSAASRRAVAPVLLVLAVACGCTVSAGPSARHEPHRTVTPLNAPVPEPVTIDVEVDGEPPVVAAYRRVAEQFHRVHPKITVDLTTAPSHEQALRRVEGVAEQRPDVFLAGRQDLPALVGRRRVRPIDALLGRRRVDFGDGYYRVGLQAFSTADRLQCMPVDVDPQVLYYNPRLVDPRRLLSSEPHQQEVLDGWGFDEFEAAVRRAAGPSVAGIWVPADVTGLAPFLASAGNELVDNAEKPTRLDLEGGQGTLQRLLALLRNPRLSLAGDLGEEGAVSRFRAGRLAMLLGDRSMLPRLRAPGGSPVDAIPLPSLGAPRSLATVTGLCLSAGSPHVRAAADFIAYTVGERGASVLARTGAVVPSNVRVVRSEAFDAPDRAPARDLAFDAAANNAVLPPLSAEWPEVVAATAPLVRGLLVDPVVDLPTLARRIDTVSARLFDDGGR